MEECKIRRQETEDRMKPGRRILDAGYWILAESKEGGKAKKLKQLSLKKTPLPFSCFPTFVLS
jgi:hypothetical protein